MIDRSRIHEVIDGVFDNSVAIPTRPYYVNYDMKVSNYIAGKGSYSTTTRYHIGPYPKLVAEFLLEHWVPTHNTPYGPHRDYHCVVRAESIALKPKRDTVIGTPPSREQMEVLLLSVLVKPLEIYRALQEQRE